MTVDLENSKAPLSSLHGVQEYTLTQKDFDFISQFVYKSVGIVLHDEKKAMVYARLTRRLRALKLNSFKEYCDYLIQDKTQQELTI